MLRRGAKEHVYQHYLGKYWAGTGLLLGLSYKKEDELL